MLKIKTLAQMMPKYVFDITNKTDRLTDFSVGSAIRTIGEATCLQLEEFYFAMHQNVNYAITHSIYEAFGFKMKPAVPSSGIVRIVFIEPAPTAFTIPRGMYFTTPRTSVGLRRFYTTNITQVIAGATQVDVNVVSEITGSISNISFNSITSVETYLPLIKEVYNPHSFTNGADAETSEDRKKRFQQYIATLSKGTRDAVLYGALEVDGVAGAYVDDNYIGYVRVYAHDLGGNLSSILRQAIIDNELNYRAAGIEVDVWPVEKHFANFNVVVYLRDGYDVNIYGNVLQDVCVKRVNTYMVSEPMYASDIISYIRWLYPDIIVDVQSESLHDMIVPKNGIVRAGAIKIICANAKHWGTVDEGEVGELTDDEWVGKAGSEESDMIGSPEFAGEEG